MDPRIRELLERANPWWTHPGARVPGTKPVRRDAFRKVADLSLSFAPGEKRRATILVGLRQVGKTVLAREVAAEGLPRLGGTQLAIVEVDDPRLTGALTLADVLHAWDPHRVPGRPALLVVDEIQKLSSGGGERDWARQLAGVVNRDEIRVLATGSAAGVLRGGGADLAGRADNVILEPLSFPEFRRLRAGAKTSPPQETRFLDRDHYLSVGGFPEFTQTLDVRLSLERTRDYVQNVLRADLAAFRAHASIVRLFAVLMDQSGEELNASGLATKLQVAQNTLKSWLDGLEEVFLVQRVPRLETSELRKIASRPKVHATDPGLIAAFAPGADPLEVPRIRGRLFESAVLRHLRELASRARGEVLCAQRRGTAGEPLGEADFLLEAGDEAFFVEVKSGEPPGSEGAERLLALSRDIREIQGGGKPKDVRVLIVHGGSTREACGLPCVPLVDFLDAVLAGPASDPCASLRGLCGAPGS